MAMMVNRRDTKAALEQIAANGKETERTFAAALLLLLKDIDGVEDAVKRVEDLAERIKRAQ